MSYSWDTDIDAVVGGLARPKPYGSPARPAKAQELGIVHAIPPPIVDLNVDQWDQRLKDEEAAKAIKETPELQGYILRNPLNGEISKDDMPALAKTAERAAVALPLVKDEPAPVGVPEAPVLARPDINRFDTEGLEKPSVGFSATRLGKALYEGFWGPGYEIDVNPLPDVTEMEMFYPSPSTETRRGLHELHILGPGPGQQLTGAFVNPALGLFDLLMRLGGAGIHGAAEIAQQSAETINLAAGKEVIDAVSFGRAIGSVAEAEMARQGAEVGAPHTGLRNATKHIIDKVKSDVAKAKVDLSKAKVVSPLGGPPPTTLSPVQIDAIARQAVFNALFESFEGTQTKGRSPSSIHDFAVEAVRDALVSVPIDLVTRIYAEKGVTPAAGDGVLGFVPDIVEQIDRAKSTGGDIKVPAAGYLAHGDKVLHESLQGDLRVGGGLTVNEAATLVKETKELTALREERAAKAVEAKAAEPTADQARLASRESMVLEREQQVADLVAREAPDIEYKSVFATGAKEELKKGETWEEKAKAYVESQRADLEELRTEITRPVEAELAKPVETQTVQPFEGDMVSTPGIEAIQAEVTEADFASPFSLRQSVGGIKGQYAIMKDNRAVGQVTARLDPNDPTTIQLQNIQVANAIDRPSLPDQRKLIRELQREFPTATHFQGERIGGSKLGARAPRTKIPNPQELIRKKLFLDPLYQDAAAAGMTEREFKLYSNNIQRHREAVATKKREVAERNARREYREKTETERKKAEEEFDNRADVTAETLLRNSGVRFDEALVDKTTVPRGLTTSKAKGGVAPDDIAGTLGYNTGAELLRDLEGLHQDRIGLGPAEYKKSIVDRKIKENVEEIADFTDEMFSDDLSRVLHDDLRVMYRQPEGKELSPPLALEELKARAERLFEETPVKDAMDLNYWMRLVREKGRQAELALLSGDIAKAFKFKGQQLLDHLMAREAISFAREFAKPIGIELKRVAREETRAQREGVRAVLEALAPPEPKEPKAGLPRWTSPTVLLNKYDKRAPPKGVAGEYTDQIHGILQQHGIPFARDVNDLRESLGGKTLREFVTEKNAQGDNIQVPDFIFDSRGAKRLEDMTVTEHRDVFKAIRSLDHAGKEAKMAMVGKEKIALEELVQRIVDNLNSLPMVYRPNKNRFQRKIDHLRYSGDALLVRAEQMFQDMDLRDPLGPLTQSVNKIIQDAKHWENDLHHWAAEEFRKFPEIERAEELIPGVPFLDSFTSPDGVEPGRPFPMKRLDAVTTAVQMGNDSNAEVTVSTLMSREKYLADPEGTTRFVRDWLENTLTKKDWNVVEAIWKLYDDIKPMEDYVHIKTSGVRPTTIRAVPWNSHTGGYFPIMQDTIGGDIAAKRADSPFDSHFRPTTTSNKHAKERTGVFMPVRIVDVYDLIPGDVRARLHNIAFKEPVRNAHKILTQPKVIEAMNKHYGQEYTNQIGYWLQEIANHWNQDDAMLAGWAALMRGVRKNLIISTLAFNANVILSPNIGPAIKQLAREAAGKETMSAVTVARKLNNGKLTQFVIENSGEIRHRMENIDRDMRTVFAEAIGTRSTAAWLKSEAARFGMYLAVKMDTKLAILAWSEEYTKAIETGRTSFYRGESKEFTHEQAVDAADQLVRLYFGSHNPVDLPGIMRMGETAKTFGTMFYGFQNIMYGRTRDVIQLGRSTARRTKEGDLKGARGDFAQALAESWMFIGLTAAFGYLYSPEQIDKDLQKGNIGMAGFHLLTGQLMSIVPGLRDVGAIVLQGYPARSAPLTEALVRIYQVAEQTITGDKGEPSLIKDWASALGLALGVPGARQIGKSGQYIWNATHGHDSDRYFTDWLRGLVYGKAEKK